MIDRDTGRDANDRGRGGSSRQAAGRYGNSENFSDNIAEEGFLDNCLVK